MEESFTASRRINLEFVGYNLVQQNDICISPDNNTP